MACKLLLFLMCAGDLLSEVPFRTTEPFLPKLNQQTNLTNINGTINVLLLSTLNVGDTFYIKFLDGNEITLLITETNIFDGKTYYFGNDLKNKDNKFGFFIDSDNRVEGGVLLKNKNVIYKLVYNQELKCYYFLCELSL